MTGPEQHAATVREALNEWATDRLLLRRNTPAGRALDELVALAREAADEKESADESFLTACRERERAEAAEARADELERNLRLAHSSADRYADAAADSLNKMHARAEAAEARADELQGRLYAIENMPPDGYLAINVEAMRPSDELEQARREADQLRAEIAAAAEQVRREGYLALAERLAALAGVQAEEPRT